MSTGAGEDATMRVLRGLGVAAVAAAGSVGASRGAYELLAAQARIARKVIPKPTTWPFNGDGLYLPGASAPQPWRLGMHADLELMIFGDSTAAGLGASSREELPGVLIAKGLAEESGQSVRLSTKAIVGASSKGLWSQIEAMQITGGRPDVSVILIGGNDITARNGLSASASRLGEAVQTLVDSGSKVVVGTCPDLGVIQPVPQPLRSIMHAWSLRLAALQAHQVRSAGGIPVPLSETLTPELRDRPDHFFSADQFHPNSAGYELAAAILLPPTLIALEIWDEDAETAADGKVSAGAETADADDATQVEGSTTEDEVDTTATANDGTVVQQLLWRLVHVVRPGDSDDASGADSDSPFDTEVFDSHRERARAEAAADDSAASGSGSHAYRPGPLPEDRNVSADSADAEARRAAGRFFRLSRFRPGGNRSPGVMGEEKAGSGTADPDTNGSAEETAELHDSRGTEPESRTDA
jgi:lysophospholipase L1-like esterase